MIPILVIENGSEISCKIDPVSLNITFPGNKAVKISGISARRLTTPRGECIILDSPKMLIRPLNPALIDNLVNVIKGSSCGDRVFDDLFGKLEVFLADGTCDKEGVFRLSGDVKLAQEMALKGTFKIQGCSIHEVAQAIKSRLRTLSVLSTEQQLSLLADGEIKLEGRELMIVKKLSQLCHQVASCKQTRMSLSSLAIVLAPCLVQIEMSLPQAQRLPLSIERLLARY